MNIRSRLRSRALAPSLALASALLLTSACGGGVGGGGGGGGPASQVDLSIGDGPAHDLLAFHATLQDLRLVRQDHSTTPNLLESSVQVELLGLSDVQRWLARAEVTPGVYLGGRLVFQPGTFSAAAKNGSPVAVQAHASSIDLPFTLPVELAPGGYRRLPIDIDLSASLSGDVSSASLQFDPVGSIDAAPDESEVCIDDFKGLVVTSSETDGSLYVQAFLDQDSAVVLGTTVVVIAPDTLLVDANGGVFPMKSDFFAQLQASISVVEVHGCLDFQGRVYASQIEIEDQQGPGSSFFLVKIEGFVLDSAPQGFQLLIQEIETGGQVALDTLAGIGFPTSIPVGISPQTAFYLGPHVVGSAGDLALGAQVKVKFQEFGSPPFPAKLVLIEEQSAKFESTLASTAGLPGSLSVHLHPGETWIPVHVYSAGIGVTVLLGKSPIVLDTQQEPTLEASDLLAGLELQVHGLLSASSTPGAPLIECDELVVHPGELDGVVAAVQPAAASFDVLVTDFDDPFGAGADGPSMHVHIDPSCVFEEDAQSAAAFFALYAGLPTGAALQVHVKGIGTGEPDQVRTFEIRVELLE